MNYYIWKIKNNNGYNRYYNNKEQATDTYTTSARKH